VCPEDIVCVTATVWVLQVPVVPGCDRDCVVLQVREGKACAQRAMDVIVLLCLPSADRADPLWQLPFNAAALVLAPLLDSCFLLLGKLAGSARRGRGGSGGESQFGKGGVTIGCNELVRPLPPAPVPVAVSVTPSQMLSQFQSQTQHN
jgi:hypothetical protein